MGGRGQLRHTPLRSGHNHEVLGGLWVPGAYTEAKGHPLPAMVTVGALSRCERRITKSFDPGLYPTPISHFTPTKLMAKK